MLRTDLNIVMSALKHEDWPGLIGQKARGKIHMDSADLVLYKADGQLVGTALSIPVHRKASLANGKYEYYDEAGNVVSSN